jgi:hypothetical protein
MAFLHLADSYISRGFMVEQNWVVSEIMWFELGAFCIGSEEDMREKFGTLACAKRILDDYKAIFPKVPLMPHVEQWCKEFLKRNQGFHFYPTVKVYCNRDQSGCDHCNIECREDQSMIITGQYSGGTFKQVITDNFYPNPIFSSLHLAMAILRSQQLFARDGRQQYLTFLESLETFYSLTRNRYFDPSVFRVILSAYLYDSSFM